MYLIVCLESDVFPGLLQNALQTWSDHQSLQLATIRGKVLFVGHTCQNRGSSRHLEI